jgi:hypothetical protein
VAARNGTKKVEEDIIRVAKIMVDQGFPEVAALKGMEKVDTTKIIIVMARIMVNQDFAEMAVWNGMKKVGHNQTSIIVEKNMVDLE